MIRILRLSILAITLSLGTNSNAQIADGGFEVGSSGGAWTAFSATWGSPICEFAVCGNCGGQCIARTGSFYVWFGGASVPETAYVEQNATFPAGTSATIDLFVSIPGPGPSLVADRLELSVDGVILETITAQDASSYIGYTSLSVDVSPLADGGSHVVRIEGFQTTDSIFNIIFDDVALTVDGVTLDLFEEYTEPVFKVFPSLATNGLINLTFGELLGETVISIVSIDGAVVSTQTISNAFNKSFVFDSASMSSGVYFVHVTNGGDTMTERIVVAN